MSDGGNIGLARTKLERAVSRLCAPQTCVHYEHTLQAPSLYEILVGNLSARQGDTRTPAQSLPPLWIDALLLQTEIDQQVRQWVPKSPRTDTPQRLTILTEKTWRPQDTNTVTDMARKITLWCDNITHLFDPQPRWSISAACPSCGKSTVYRRDTAGEMVRQPALMVVASVGCTCQHCDAHWTPDRYLFLCRLLGLELPAGVLE